MLDREKYLLNWWDKIKLAIGALCVSLMFVQLSYASKMLIENDTKVKMIEPQHYNELQYYEEIAGEIKKNDIIMSFMGNGESVSYYLIKVNDNQVIVVKTLWGSECDAAMGEMLAGKRDSIQYKARVNTLVDRDLETLNLQVLTGDELYKHGLGRNLQSALIHWTLDITLYDATTESKYIIATIAGAVIMLAAAVWAFWKPFGKIGLQYAARFGKVDLGLTKKEDLPVEKGWFTDGQPNEEKEEEYHPITMIDSNDAPVEFYQSSLNDEGNFYVQKSEEPEPTVNEEEMDFKHKHKNY